MTVSSSPTSRITVDWGQGTVADGGASTLFTVAADASYAIWGGGFNDTSQTSDTNYSQAQVYTGGTGENDLYDYLGDTFRTGATWNGSNGGRFISEKYVAAGQDIRIRQQIVLGSPGTLGHVWVLVTYYDERGSSSGTPVRRTRSTWGQGTGAAGYHTIYTPPSSCLYADVWVEHNDTSQTDDNNYSGSTLHLNTADENHLYHNRIDTFRTGDTDRRNGSATFPKVRVPGGVPLIKRHGVEAGSPGTLGWTYRAVEYYG